MRAILVEYAHGAARTRHCQFRKYHKALTVRRGHKRAIVATAHKILRCIFAVLRDGTPYRDPATDYASGSFHARYEPSVRSDGANSARCVNARAQRRSSRPAATSA